MAYVELLKLGNDGQQTVVVTCALRGSVVVCVGDAALVRGLEVEGIRDYREPGATDLFPRDGRIFLKQLKNSFSSGYLNATEIKEGESTAKNEGQTS